MTPEETTIERRLSSFQKMIHKKMLVGLQTELFHRRIHHHRYFRQAESSHTLNCISYYSDIDMSP